MNKKVLSNLLSALKNPTVLVSVISQLAAILLFMGFDIDEQALMTGIGTVMSLLGSFGIISKVDMSKSKIETTNMFCPIDKKISQYIKIGGKWVCEECGHVFDPQADQENAWSSEPKKPAARKTAPRKTAAKKTTTSKKPAATGKPTATRKPTATKKPTATGKTTAPKKPAAKKPAAATAARTKTPAASPKKTTPKKRSV